MTLSLLPDVSLFINYFTEKKHQYQQNFFKNFYIPNLTVSKNKAVLFNFLTKKIKKIKKTFMIRKDWHFCNQILQTASALDKKLKLSPSFFSILILLFSEIFSTLIFHLAMLSSNTRLKKFSQILQKLWWVKKLVQWIENHTLIVNN